MSFLEELKSAKPRTLGDSDYTFVDGDTLQDPSGQGYRIQGIDAAEVSKILPSGNVKAGTAGGQVTTDVMYETANKQGFTNVVPLFNPDGSQMMDPNGRQVVDLQDDAGRSFKQELIKSGAFDVNQYTTEQDIIARDLYEGQKKLEAIKGGTAESAFDAAAMRIKEGELEEGAKQLGFKKTLLNEQERANYIQAYMQQGMTEEQAKAELDKYFTQDVQVRSFDRDINNVSLNQFSDSWEQGWHSVGQAAFGLANMIGEETGAEGLADWGEQGVLRKQQKMGEYGIATLDYKDVDSVGDALNYIGNNLAMSLPYMAGTLAGAAVTAATGGGALAIAAGAALPASVYSGQIWNEQSDENKNAGYAIAGGILQAGFDRLGLSFAMPKGVGTKELMKQATKQYAQKAGVSEEVAKDVVADMTRRGLAEVAGDAAKVAKEQIAAKQLFKQMGGTALVGAGGEALTEMGQELIGYTAAHAETGDFNFSDLNNRLISAAIAGGALGGALSVPSGVHNAAVWADIAYRLDPATADTASQSQLYAAEEKAKHGRIMSIEEIVADAGGRAKVAPGITIDERAQMDMESKKGRGLVEQAGYALGNVNKLWQGTVRSIFTPEMQQKYRTARKMADVYGGNLQRIFSGSNFENSKSHRVSVYKNMVADPDQYYKAFGVSGTIKRGKQRELSDYTYKTLNAAVDKNGRFNPDLIPQDAKNRPLLIKLGQDLNRLSDQMYQDQKKHNPELGYIDNYLFKYKALDKGAVNKRQAEFRDLLRTEFGMDAGEAKRIVNEILDNPNVSDVDEAFSVVKGGIVPGAHKKRSLGLSEKEKFKDFFEKDLFNNVSHAVKSAARYTAHRDYIGENGAVASKLLDDLQAEGMPEAEVNAVAAQLKNYFDAESGNYNRPTSEWGRKMQRLQKNFMFFSTLSSLPLATVSSVVEYALVHKALSKDEIFGKHGSLRNSGKELAKEFLGIMDQEVLPQNIGRPGLDKEDMLKHLGFREWDVGAATVTGVTETNTWQQPMYEIFFKSIGLKQWTDTTRAIRASIAGDYMYNKAQLLADHRRSGEPDTRESQEAEEALRNLGIDVDQFINTSQKVVAGIPITDQETQFLENTMREATYNFINDAVALPGSANRPLIYQDPRFALFTQFQGFIATFTANHIPKLWGEYVKRGTPAMKYSAFATMATMIMLGFVSQHLKDFLKYGFEDDGEENKTALNPYLDSPEYIQRGIRASGLLGTGERVLDWFMPIYEQRSHGVGDWAWNVVSGESPAIGYGERVGKAAGNILEGNFEKGVYGALKASPLAGPFTELNEKAASLITTGDWDYKGE